MTPTTKGITIFIFHQFTVVLLSLLVRLLADTSLQPEVILVWRGVFANLMLIPFIWYANKTLLPKFDAKKTLLIRCIFGVAAMFGNFYCIARMDLPDFVAIGYIMPILSAVLAIFILGEFMGIRRWSGALIGFVGMLVIIQPGFDKLGYVIYILLAAILLQALVAVIIRGRLTSQSSVTATYYLNYCLILAPLIFCWQYISLNLTTYQYLLLISLGVISNILQVSMIYAYRYISITTATPFSFTSLVFASVMSYFILGQGTSLTTIIGALIIVASATYIAWREMKLAKIKRTH